MQMIHLELSSVFSGNASVLPFSVTKNGAASPAEVGVKRSLATQGFSSGWRLEAKATRITMKISND